MDCFGKSELYQLRRRIIDMDRDIQIAKLDLEACEKRISELLQTEPETKEFMKQIDNLLIANAREKQALTKVIADEQLKMEELLSQLRKLISLGKTL